MGTLTDPPFTLGEIFNMQTQVNKCTCTHCVFLRRFLATVTLLTAPSVSDEKKNLQGARVNKLVDLWLTTSVNIVSEEGDGQMHWRGPERLRRGMLQLLRGEEFDLSIPLTDEERKFLGLPPEPPA